MVMALLQERSIELIEEDVMNGKVSPDQAESRYGLIQKRREA
jgi:hypothetical protein